MTRRNKKNRALRGTLKSKNATYSTIKDAVLKHLYSNPTKTFNPKQLAANLRLNVGNGRIFIQQALNELRKEESINAVGNHRYRLNYKGDRYDAVFIARANGRHTAKAVENDEIFLIDNRDTRNALNGDRVRIEVLPKTFSHSNNRAAQVVEILERAQGNYVGVLQKPLGAKVGFVIPEGNKIQNDIFIPDKYTNDAKDGDMVLVRVMEWRQEDKNPVGEIIDVLGRPEDNDTQMHAILAEFGLPYKYPEELEQLANELPEGLSEKEHSTREDLRHLTTFTIDPIDAKDFDDAISYERLENGNVSVGVHIADVSFYVKPGDPIDIEAQKRATSIYLVDRTIPMLPERLCNDLCSLKPNVDRPAYSVIFELNDKAEVVNYKIAKSIIHSDARLTYEQAYEIIKGEGDPAEEVRQSIIHLSEIAQKIRNKRFEAGAINFERQEVKFILDDQGKPTDVYTKESNEAHQLIEEFMLLANRTIAQHVTEKHLKSHPKRAFIYRIHDLPNEAKLQDLTKFMMKLKYVLKLDGNKEHISKALNEMLVAFRGKPEQNMLETIVLRTMAKAIYTTDNIGHYGLGFPFYTHFTSPIRRYPDVLVHRYLWAYEHEQELDSPGILESQARHCSDQEQLASQAERASIKLKQVEYMSDKIGERFEGMIISVTDFGFFVEIKSNGCEGLVPMHSLTDDFYVYDEKNFCLIGRQYGKVFKLGDSVEIEVDKVNFERKQIDFILC